MKVGRPGRKAPSDGVRIAHAKVLGVLGVVPRRDGFGNLDEGFTLGDQERV